MVCGSIWRKECFWTRVILVISSLFLLSRYSLVLFLRFLLTLYLWLQIDYFFLAKIFSWFSSESVANLIFLCYSEFLTVQWSLLGKIESTKFVFIDIITVCTKLSYCLKKILKLYSYLKYEEIHLVAGTWGHTLFVIWCFLCG